ncbi:hypothetical protein B0H17DRAFT_1327717 [Mycena rosella]|uniref:Arrestin-like N-terminal domain-containing protein n=1 Tax=Mycena rosella TaxID=1033263 RepID=A0AAD7DXD6_MYCRO|nr:hypothetical protein B0H17DRAFT_1327717 [Mycena rosella]
MSLLRDVLKRNQKSGPKADGFEGILALPTSSRRSVKSYASSIKSSGGASIRSLAESMMSFYSMMTSGGTRIPKRRRPDFSRLGVPEWFAEDPPPPPLMPGTAPASPIPIVYTRGIAGVLHSRYDGDTPWLGLVVYSHARPDSIMPMYHNAAKVVGEVRLVVKSSMKLSSIDVWVTVKSDSVLDLYKPPIAAMTVNVWNRRKGDPRSATPGAPPHKGKFPKGTYVFPFDFPALLEDTVVQHPDDTKRRNKARLPMPPSYHISMLTGFSGNIQYTVGVNIVDDGLGGIDDEFDMPFQYLPLCKPLPRVPTPFPYIPTREDWPLSREVVGGWTLTPFGGRGRLGEEAVEIEGILGVQEPAVYTAGQTLEFSLLLWSKNPLALEALGQPGAVEVGFYKSDIFAQNVLQPRTSSRKNRYLTKLTAGRMWRTDDGRPADDAPVPEIQMVTLPDPPPPGAAPAATPSAQAAQHRVKGAPSSRFQEVLAEPEEEKDGSAAGGSKQVALDGDASLGEVDAALATLNVDGEAPSQEAAPDGDAPDDATLQEDGECLASAEGTTDHFVRLDGEVRIPACSHPSFRYTNMGREYVVHLIITHPQYHHISPNATGLLAEFPVWYVLDRFAHIPRDLAKLPVNGTTIPVGPDAIRAPVAVGAYTEEKRPTAKFTRYFALFGGPDAIRAPVVVGAYTDEGRPTGRFAHLAAF